MKRTRIAALVLIIAASPMAAAQTQAPLQPPAQTAQGGIPGGTSPEKLALLKELYSLMRAGEMAEKSSLIMLEQFRKQLPEMISRAYGDLLTSNTMDGKTLEQRVKESSDRILSRVRELMPARVKFGEVMEQIFIPVYDHNFTEQEIRDLVAFYKSPTGKKSIEVMPDIMNETMRKGMEIMAPRIMGLMDQILEEEKARLLKK